MARTALAHRNMRCGKRNNKRVRDEEPPIPAGHAATHGAGQKPCRSQLLKVNVTCRNQLDPTPGKVADWVPEATRLIIGKVFNPLGICNLQ